MPTKITKLKLHNYIATGCATCPDCGSESVNQTFHVKVASSAEAIRDRECFNCGFKWQDLYVLTDIIPDLEQL